MNNKNVSRVTLELSSDEYRRLQEFAQAGSRNEQEIIREALDTFLVCAENPEDLELYRSVRDALKKYGPALKKLSKL